jgi:ankyrin repeat protein
MDNYARGAAFLNLRFNFRYDDFLKYIADDPNERFDDDQTALHLLMYENEPPANLEVDNLARKRVIKQLLDWKADIDAADEGGDTPLYMAVCAQNVPIVKFLLEQGANMRPARDEDDELVLQAYNQETFRCADCSC